MCQGLLPAWEKRLETKQGGETGREGHGGNVLSPQILLAILTGNDSEGWGWWLPRRWRIPW